MINRKNIIQDSLDRIHSGKHPDSMVRKRKISRIILLIDLLVIALILVFINKSQPDKIYLSTDISYQHFQYRFSLSQQDNRDYIFTLTIENRRKSNNSTVYNNSVAELNILYKDKNIYHSLLGEGINSITLNPDEIKTLIKKINSSAINEVAKFHPEYIIKNKSLLSLAKGYLPLTAVLTINHKEKISAAINYKHEVD